MRRAYSAPRPCPGTTSPSNPWRATGNFPPTARLTQHAQKVGDRLEVPEVAALNPPVVRRSVSQEGPPLGPVEVAFLRFGGYHRPKRAAVGHARHTAAQMLSGPGRLLGGFHLGLGRRGRISWLSFLLGFVSRESLHLLHQPPHASGLKKRFR